MYPVWVHPPRNAAELAKAMGPYCSLGLNGAFESMDVVHLHWGELMLDTPKIIKYYVLLFRYVPGLFAYSSHG